jgi:hypothetical protein
VAIYRRFAGPAKKKGPKYGKLGRAGASNGAQKMSPGDAMGAHDVNMSNFRYHRSVTTMSLSAMPTGHRAIPGGILKLTGFTGFQPVDFYITMWISG